MQTPSSILSAAANLVFTFGSHALIPEEVREMTVPSEFYRSYNWAYAFVVPLYFLFGFVGFWAFGVFNSGANLLLNFHDTAAVKSVRVCFSVAAWRCGCASCFDTPAPTW